ncbi:MAG: sensor histidine kinase [Chloroflexi bacterium]|nr:MAG: sensor histidine kinase [Chloroflexota bacterium]
MVSVSDDLKQWLQKESATLVTATLHRAPNMLPGAEETIEFLNRVIELIGKPREEQLSAIQFWALTTIGHDAPAANDWLTILRVLKEEIGYGLENQMSAVDALRCWRLIDDVLTYALIEVSQIASDMERATLLEHMVELKQQIAQFEQSKSNFITVAAHELKTPLTILEGYANMLRAETEPDSQLRIYVDGLENGIRRMNEIINDMIDVSLIDLKSFELNYQQFYLERIVLLVADNVSKYFFERHVDLLVMPFDAQVRTYGDPEMLAKAFNKVIMNALKYTPDGGKVTITGVLTRQDERNEFIGGYMDVRVADTGIGINPEDLERIFERFTSTSNVNLHSSSKIKFKGGGPGLGLPIAKGIIEAHGGRIWAESPGCDEVSCPGSVFHIELPIYLKKPE